jgi:ABC-type branched-subunit amino acid transport system substrate-binding protein
MEQAQGRAGRRPKAVTGALLLALLVAAACGQKTVGGDGGSTGAAAGQYPPAAPTAAAPSAPGVTPGSEGGIATTPSPGQGSALSTTARSGPAARSSVVGGLLSPAGSGPSAAGNVAAPPAGGGSGAPAPAANSPSTDSPGGPGPVSPTPGPGAASGPVDRTGVSDTVIKIGVHAPLTGAAPLPQNAFDKGKDVYWKFLAAKGGLLGRNVQIIFKDDQFNPAHAVQVCRELVEQDKVFLLFGVAGSEQITACARYANSVGVPYLSAGVNEDGLTGLPNYFAVSQTYAQQNRTIAALVRNRLHKTKIAIVLNATPALNETQRSITAEAQASGLSIVRQSRISKNASDSELVAEAQQLRSSGAEAVYVLTAPVNFIKLATNAYAQAYAPLWTGPGLTNGLNIVTEAGCPAVEGAHWLSPFPQLDVIDRLDPDYKPAYRQYAGGDPDDIGLAEWGLNKTLHLMMDAAGRDLSRQSFIRALTSGRRFASNVFPALAYDGSIRFGANSMHVLRADCSSRSWKTETVFAEGF